jgi:Uma2 family endonuclease
MTTAELTRPKATAKAKRLWTYAEMVAELPETNLPTELWNGDLIMSPAPHPSHQEITLNFAYALKEFVARKKLGKVYASPVDVVLTARRVVQPDVLFIAKARLGIVKDCIAGVPDLAMEVISEHSWQRDRIEKKALYEQAGLPEHWIVDPDSETIEVFALAGGVYQLHSGARRGQTALSKLLPGFGLSFRELLP